MPSPFPGMDPYLEGPNVHHALATKIRQLLVPLLAPRYVVRIEVSVIRDEERWMRERIFQAGEL